MRDDELIRLVNDCVTNDIGTAIGVVHQLQEWLEGRRLQSLITCAWLRYSAYTLEVGINEFVLWNSDDGYVDMEFDYEEGLKDLSCCGCLRAFLAEIEKFRPFLEGKE